MGKKDEGMDLFTSGAKRKKMSYKVRYDLISPFALERIALTYGEGAEVYGDRNWEKGLPMEDLINHALNHIILYMKEDKSEDHLAHAVWNLMGIMHFEALLFNTTGEEK